MNYEDSFVSVEWGIFSEGRGEKIFAQIVYCFDSVDFSGIHVKDNTKYIKKFLSNTSNSGIQLFVAGTNLLLQINSTSIHSSSMGGDIYIIGNILSPALSSSGQLTFSFQEKMNDNDTEPMYGSDMEGMYNSDMEEAEDMQVSLHAERKTSTKQGIISLNMKNTIVDTLQVYDPNTPSN